MDPNVIESDMHVYVSPATPESLRSNVFKNLASRSARADITVQGSSSPSLGLMGTRSSRSHLYMKPANMKSGSSKPTCMRLVLDQNSRLRMRLAGYYAGSKCLLAVVAAVER